MPDHPVWNALESHFRTRIAPGERQQVVQIVQRVLAEQPDVDLDALVVQVTRSILSRRR